MSSHKIFALDTETGELYITQEPIDLSNVSVVSEHNKVPIAGPTGKLDPSWIPAAGIGFEETGDLVFGVRTPLINRATAADGAIWNVDHTGVWGSQTLDKAFDGDDTTSYGGSGSSAVDVLITVTLSAVYDITTFRLSQAGGGNQRNWELHASPDAVSWTKVAEDKNNLASMQTDTGLVVFDDVVSAKFWRLYLFTPSQNPAWAQSVVSFELYTGDYYASTERVPIGEEGQVLQILNGEITWASGLENTTYDHTIRGKFVQDVDPQDEQVLVWNDTEQEWQPQFLSELGDITLRGRIISEDTPDDGSVYVWDSSLEEWVPQTIPLDDTTIQGHSVSIVAPSLGDVLRWDGSNWAPYGGDLFYVDPMTTTGDMVVSIDGVPLRLPIGLPGTVLTVDNGMPAWRSIGSSTDAASLRGNSVRAGVPESGDALVWDGEAWSPTAINDVGFDAVTLRGYDVDNTAPTSGQFLRWNGAESRWEPQTYLIDTLQGRDVAGTAPTAFQVLTWNADVNRWEPQTVQVDPIQFSEVGGLLYGNYDALVNRATSAEGATWISTRSRYSSAYDLDNAFDGNPASNYYSNGGENTVVTITITLSEAHSITRFNLLQTDTDHVRAWELEYSTDNAIWTKIDEDLTDPSLIERDTGIRVLSETIEAQYWRFNFLNPSKNPEYGIGVCLIQFFTGTLSVETGELAAGSENQVLRIIAGKPTWTDLTEGENAAQLRGNNVSDTPPNDNYVLIWDETNSYWKPGVITHIQGQPVTDTIPSIGQALVWNGSAWTPGNAALPEGGTEGQVLTRSGADTIWADLPGGDATSLHGYSIHNTTPIDGQVLTWNGAESRWEFTTPAAIGLPSGAVNGKLLGYENDEPAWVDSPSGDAVSLQGSAISTTTPEVGQILIWNGSEWVPDDVSENATSINGQTIHDTAPLDGSALIWNQAANRWEPGTVTGANAISLRGRMLHDVAPTDGQILVWNATDSRWEASDLQGGGSGDAISLQGNAVHDAAPSDGQALVWNAAESRWEPGNTSGGDGYSDPLTTDGDILIRTGGSTTRLPIGSDTQILRVVSGTPSWSDESAGGGSGDATSLQGNAIAETSPTEGQALVWNDTESRWEPGNVTASGSGLPEGGTEGQVLSIVTGEPGWTDSPTELPLVDALADEGKFLRIIDGETSWAPADSAEGMMNPMAGAGDLIVGSDGGSVDNIVTVESYINGDFNIIAYDGSSPTEVIDGSDLTYRSCAHRDGAWWSIVFPQPTNITHFRCRYYMRWTTGIYIEYSLLGDDAWITIHEDVWGNLATGHVDSGVVPLNDLTVEAISWRVRFIGYGSKVVNLYFIELHAPLTPVGGPERLAVGDVGQFLTVNKENKVSWNYSPAVSLCNFRNFK